MKVVRFVIKSIKDWFKFKMLLFKKYLIVLSLL